MKKNWRLSGGLLVTVAMWLAFMIAPPAFADNAVNFEGIGHFDRR